MKIIYTHTDEAPALATVFAAADHRGVRRGGRTSSRAARHLAGRADPGPVPGPPAPTSSASPTRWPSSASWPRRPRPTSSSCPTSAPRCRSSRRRSPSCRSRATTSPTTPTSPTDDEQREVRARYDKVKGSAVNPVLRQGNSDRRAPASVKDYARKHPHSMGEWSPDSRSHVATMSDGDFRSTEQSVTVERRRARCGSSTSAPTAR